MPGPDPVPVGNNYSAGTTANGVDVTGVCVNHTRMVLKVSDFFPHNLSSKGNRISQNLKNTLLGSAQQMHKTPRMCSRYKHMDKK